MISDYNHDFSPQAAAAAVEGCGGGQRPPWGQVRCKKPQVIDWCDLVADRESQNATTHRIYQIGPPDHESFSSRTR